MLEVLGLRWTRIVSHLRRGATWTAIAEADAELRHRTTPARRRCIRRPGGGASWIERLYVGWTGARRSCPVATPQSGGVRGLTNWRARSCAEGVRLTSYAVRIASDVGHETDASSWQAQ